MTWVAIGSTAVSVVGGFINSKNASSSRSSSGQSGYDPNVKAGTDQAISTAQQVANTPWSGINPDVAIAGLTQNQVTAQQEAASNGEQLPGLDATANQAFTQGNLQKYMSPYEANVLDVQKQYATRDYTQQLAGQQSKEAMTNAFGGDRSVLGENQLTRDYNLNLEGIQAKGLQDAYTAGTGAFNQDRSYAAGRSAQIGGALASTGAVAQSTNQLRGNFANSQFNEQRDWSKNQNAYLAQILGQVPKGSYYSGNQTAYTNPGTGGWGGALAGAAQIGMAGISAFQGTGPSGGSALPNGLSAQQTNDINSAGASSAANYPTGDPTAGLNLDMPSDGAFGGGGGAIPAG